jgi:hypothetical protein
MALHSAVSAIGFAVVWDTTSFRVFHVFHVVISDAWFNAAASMLMALFPRASFVQFNSAKDLMVVFGTILVRGIRRPVLDLSGYDYRITLLAGAVLSLLCLARLARLQTGELAEALEGVSHRLTWTAQRGANRPR